MGRKPDHDDIVELLPWFVNESLGERERQQILTHLRDCAECRHERDRLQSLQQMVVEDDDAEGENYHQAFQHLMTRIAVAEANRISTREFKPEKRYYGWLPYAGVAASLIALFVFTAMLQPARDEQAQYRTLSSTTSQPGVIHRIALTFEQPLKAETLRAALIETHSNIVSGPDEKGTYVVEVRIPEQVTDARFIQSIRDIDGVKYAAFEARHTNSSH